VSGVATALEGSPLRSNLTLKIDKSAGNNILPYPLNWFHQYLNRDLPENIGHNTARDYYRDRRERDNNMVKGKPLRCRRTTKTT
jgi:hypothetical protein